MMELGKEIEVHDPYTWLPPYGETGVNFSTQEGNLSVIVEYDGVNGTLKKELLFTNVCAFYGSALPGPQFLDFSYNAKNTTPLGSLVEYPDSEAAAAWVKHFNDGRVVKHYRIAFLAANSILMVFASDCLVR